MADVGKRYDVLLSYNQRDRSTVEALAEALRQNGFSVFLDQWYLLPGRPWPETLEETLQTCNAMGVCLGPQGMGGWQRRETYLGLERQSRQPEFSVIPILLPGAEPALGFLSLNTWIDLSAGPDDRASVAALAAAIRGQAVSQAEQHLIQIAQAICPYRGLHPFREEDKEFFFGRDPMVDRLTAMVEERPLITVVGASGSGKSSLVRAGLIPRLRYQRRGAVWDVTVLTPGEHPFRSLAAALIPALEPAMTETERLAETAKLARYLSEGDVALRDVVSRLLEKQTGTTRLALVIDQWEELYTLGREPAAIASFIDTLLEAIAGGALTIIVTLRGDFFGRVLGHRPLADRLQDALITLGPMRHDELRQSIAEPAAKVGLGIEAGLMTRILEDLSDEPGDLPLLEFVLAELWELRYQGQLTHEAYERLGGVRGAIARHAEAVFARLDKTTREGVQRVMLRLVQPGSGTEDTRRPAHLADLDAAAQSATRQLAAERLLVMGRDDATGEAFVQVAHEALIKQWGRLTSWIDEARGFLVWRQRLAFALSEWQAQGRDPGALLRGTLLMEASEQLEAQARELSPSEREFISESIRHRERLSATQTRRRRQLLGGLAAGMAVAVALALWAIVERQGAQQAYRQAVELRQLAETQRDDATRARQEADSQRDIAVARELATKAELALGESPDGLAESGWLTAASLQRAQTLEGYLAWARVMKRLPHRLDLPHGDAVFAVAFSPDARRVATASADETVRVWDVESGAELGSLPHDHNVWDVAFSPNGAQLATASGLAPKDSKPGTGEARLWAADSQTMLARLPQDSAVWAVAFSPDGKHLAIRGFDKVRLWDTVTRAELATLSHPGDVWDMTFSPDGALMATAVGLGTGDQRRGEVRLWETATGLESARLPHDRPVGSVAFSPDGSKLASASGNVARIWDTGSRRELVRVAHDKHINDIAFDPTGSRLATGSEDATARVWDVSTGTELARFPNYLRAFAVTFSPDSERLASADRNSVKVWWLATEKEVHRMGIPEDFWPHDVAFSPDGLYLAVATGHPSKRFPRPGQAQLWSLMPARAEVAHFQHEGPVTAVSFAGGTRQTVAVCKECVSRLRIWDLGSPASPVRTDLNEFDPSAWPQRFIQDGRVFLAANRQWLRWWDAAGGDLLATVEHEAPVQHFDVGADGSLVATASRTVAQVWKENPASPDAKVRRVARLEHPALVYAVALSPDGKRLLSGAKDGAARLWDVAGGEEISRLAHDSGEWVWDVDYSADGGHLATVSSDQSARVWDAASGRPVAKLVHDHLVRYVTISPDGRRLVSIGSGKTHLWDVGQRAQLAVTPTGDRPNDAMFSPDGSLLATAATDRGKVVHLWHTPSGRQLARFPHPEAVSAFAFSPDSRHLVTGSRDGSVRVWLTRATDLLDALCARIQMELIDPPWLSSASRRDGEPVCPVPGLDGG